MSEPPSLLLLHYFGGSARSWDRFVARLGPSWHCAVPDMRGFGGNHAGGPYAVADYAEDAEALAAGLGRFVLVGHSMGGKVATALAARQPPGLVGLVLVAPSPPCPEPMTDEAREALRAAFGSTEGAERTARAISVRADSGPQFDEAVFDRIVRDHMAADRAAWDAWLDVGSREDISVPARQVAVPVLVVAGAEDAGLGPEVQQRLTLPRLSDARMETVRDSRHLVPLDQPEALARIVERFCADASGSQPETSGLPPRAAPAAPSLS